MSLLVFGCIFLAASLKGFLTALNRAIHPATYPQRWRWISWGDTMGRYRSQSQVVARFELVFTGAFVLAGFAMVAAGLLQ